MRVTLNHVILSGLSDGTRQRDLNVLRSLDQELCLRGHKLDILLASNIDKQIQEKISNLAEYATVLNAPVPALPTYKRMVGTFLYLKNFLKDHPSDIFHQSYYPVPAVGCNLAVTVNDLRFAKFPETYSKQRRMFLEYVVPKAIRQADLVFAISEWTKWEIVDLYGVHPEKIFTAPIPYNSAFVREENREKLERVKALYRLPETFLLCVGHLEPRKNYERIIDAFHSLDQGRHRNVALVIVGKPNLKWKKLLNKSRRSHRSKRIMFTGYIPDADLPSIYSLARALVFPSLHEGFGIPLLEAMGCGLPIITSSTTAMPEVVGDAGVLVNPQSVSEIAGAIDTVLSSEMLRKDLVQKGKSRLKTYSSKLAASKLVDGYESIRKDL